MPKEVKDDDETPAGLHGVGIILLLAMTAVAELGGGRLRGLWLSPAIGERPATV